MNTLQLEVGVVFLELELNGLVEVNVRSLDRVHILLGQLKLVEFKVFREYLHLYL
jgi:hypothetical protein